MGRKIIDRFTNLPVSRQRKYQLRMKARKRCIICGEPVVRASYCLYHMVKYRELARARVNAQRRNYGARSYQIEMALRSRKRSARRAARPATHSNGAQVRAISPRSAIKRAA
ncbi:MAG: hypothetical protein N3I86_08525 [Verrucomicrobiae bacterium]|nr:hypothetical protein [Verrucomicrobiae bacterium]MDW8307773.1 hypothetical protein [Verrucomicrobiales bacterium]